MCSNCILIGRLLIEVIDYSTTNVYQDIFSKYHNEMAITCDDVLIITRNTDNCTTS